MNCSLGVFHQLFDVRWFGHAVKTLSVDLNHSGKTQITHFIHKPSGRKMFKHRFSAAPSSNSFSASRKKPSDFTQTKDRSSTFLTQCPTELLSEGLWVEFIKRKVQFGSPFHVCHRINV